LAALDQGENRPPPDDAAKAKLRSQALDWLSTKLTVWTKFPELGPEYRPVVARALVTRQSDCALAGIRDAAALDKLPTEEQKAFAQLWADAAVLLKRCSVKVEIIKAEYGASDRWNDVTEVPRRHVTDLPLITLPSLSSGAPRPHKECFGDLPLKKLSYDFQAGRDAKILRTIETLEEVNGVPAEKLGKHVDQKKKP
jgi:hypothetical protein